MHTFLSCSGASNLCLQVVFVLRFAVTFDSSAWVECPLEVFVRTVCLSSGVAYDLMFRSLPINSRLKAFRRKTNSSLPNSNASKHHKTDIGMQFREPFGRLTHLRSLVCVLSDDDSILVAVCYLPSPVSELQPMHRLELVRWPHPG